VDPDNRRLVNYRRRHELLSDLQRRIGEMGEDLCPLAAELLANGRLKGLLERAARFDWIVLDSPSASTVCDASIMAEVCDGVLLVVQATKTPSLLAEKAIQQFAGRPILGAVVNRSDLFRPYKRNGR